eukprot:872279-Rhodomonas_salina.1
MASISEESSGVAVTSCMPGDCVVQYNESTRSPYIRSCFPGTARGAQYQSARAVPRVGTAREHRAVQRIELVPVLAALVPSRLIPPVRIPPLGAPFAPDAPHSRAWT